MTDDRLAALGLALFVVGWAALWWQFAIILAGAGIVSLALLRAMLRRRARASEGNHEG